MTVTDVTIRLLIQLKRFTAIGVYFCFVLQWWVFVDFIGSMWIQRGQVRYCDALLLIGCDQWTRMLMDLGVFRHGWQILNGLGVQMSSRHDRCQCRFSLRVYIHLYVFGYTVNKDARQSMASDVFVCVDSVMDCWWSSCESISGWWDYDWRYFCYEFWMVWQQSIIDRFVMVFPKLWARVIGILASFMCDLSGFFDAGGLYHFIQIHKFYRFIFVDCFGMLSALAELLQCNLSAQRRRC